MPSDAAVVLGVGVWVGVLVWVGVWVGVLVGVWVCVLVGVWVCVGVILCVPLKNKSKYGGEGNPSNCT